MHWLLLSAQRCEPEQLYMTHDHIAKMLGVRRASITLAAKELKDEGLMDYSRGRIRLLDIAALHKRTLS
jgi:Mn-dependent DtxR family transcriptional regulator